MVNKRRLCSKPNVLNLACNVLNLTCNVLNLACASQSFQIFVEIMLPERQKTRTEVSGFVREVASAGRKGRQ